MLIRKLFETSGSLSHMVLETIDGEFKKFFISPFRKIEEKDLSNVPCWRPVGRNGEETAEYMYRFYGFQKADKCDSV